MTHNRRHALHTSRAAAASTPISDLAQGIPRNTADAWKSAVSGTWATAVDWSTGTVPNASTDATIDGGLISGTAVTQDPLLDSEVGRVIGPQVAITPDNWAAAKNGAWSGAANWSTGKSPTISNDATIAVAGKYTVSIAAASVANSLTVSDGGATISDNSTLTIATLLTISAGTFQLNPGGMVAGGTLAASGSGSFSFAGVGNYSPSSAGTLSGVTYQGTLNLSQADEGVVLANGFTLAGAGGTGSGTINLTGADSYLYIADNETLANATLNIGDSSSGSFLELYNGGDQAETLTLASNFNVVQVGTYANIAAFPFGGTVNQSIINQGTITAAFANGQFTLGVNNAGSFTNTGTVAVSNTGAVTIGTQSFTNSGVITVSGTFGTNLFINSASVVNTGTLSVVGTGDQAINSSDSYLYIGGSNTGTWTNQGVISVSNGGDVVLGGTFSLATFKSITDKSGFIDIAGTLQNTGTLVALSLVDGYDTLYVDPGSTIAGGTIQDQSGHIYFAGGGRYPPSSAGTLSGVTYQGTLNLSQADEGVVLANGFTLAGAGGTGSGTINLTGADSYLYIADNETLANATLNIGDSSSGSFLELYNGGDQAETLTLASNFNVVQVGTYANIAAFPFGGTVNQSIINQGTITAAFANGQFTLGVNNAGSFTNTGTVAVSNTGAVTIGTQSFTNSGVITVSGTFGTNLFINSASVVNTGTLSVVGTGDQAINSSDSYLYIGGSNTGTWTNQGVISVSNGGDVVLGGTFSLATFKSITDKSGFIDIAGTLQNTGTLVALSLVDGYDTLYVDPGSTIAGGTIQDQSGHIYFAGGGRYPPSSAGTLSGVTYQGTLNLSQADEGVVLANGFTLAGAGGTGSGTINLTGADSYLYIADNETLANATLNIGDSSSGSFLELYNGGDQAETLTLASNFNVVQVGTYANIAAFPFGGTVNQSIINQGTITAAFANGQFTLGVNNAGSFTNTGTIIVSNGATFTLGARSFASLKSGVLSGSYEVDANSLLQLGSNEFITTLAGTVTLSGTGSTLQALATNNNTQVTIDLRLAAISAGGALNLLAGRSLSAKASFIDNGSINLGGGTLSESSFSIGSGGTLSGFGKVNVAVADGGRVVASNGTLSLMNAVSGTGTLAATAGGTLQLLAGGTLTETMTGAGTLLLAGSASYTLSPGISDAIATTTIATGSTLTATGTIGGAVAVAGVLAVGAGTLLIGGALTGGGTVSISSGGVLDLAGGGTFAGSIGGAGTLQLDGAAPFVLAAGGSLAVPVTVDAGATLDLTAGGPVSAAASGAGTLELTGAAYTLAAGTTLSIGTLAVDAGASLTGAGTLTGMLADAGTVEATGSLTLAGISGSGTLLADAGATVDLTAASALTQSITGAGTLQLDSGVYTLSGGSVNVAALTIDAGATLSGSGTITGALTDAGTVAAAGGTLTLGAISGGGTLSAGSGATLNLTAGATLGSVTGTGTLLLSAAARYQQATGTSLTIARTVIGAGATLDLVQGGTLGTFSGAGTLELSGTSYTAGATLPAVGALQLDAGASLAAAAGTFAGVLTDAGTLSLATGKTLDLTGGGTVTGKLGGSGTLEVGAGALTLSNANLAVGAVTIDAGATLAGYGISAAAIINNGTIDASDGRLALNGALSGTGVLTTQAAATLALQAGGTLGQVTGAGTLELDAAYTLGVHQLDVSNLRVDTGASITGTGRIDAVLTDDGTVAATGGTLVLASAIAGDGTLSVAAGAELDLLHGGSFAGTINGAGTLDILGKTKLNQGTVLAVGTVNQTAQLSLNAGVALQNNAGALYNLTATTGHKVKLLGSPSASFTNAGSLVAAGGGLAEVGVMVLNSGDVLASAGTLSFLDAVTDNATMRAIGGTLSFKDSVGGTGTLEVGNGGTLSLLAGAGSGQTVTFEDAAGRVNLTKPLSFTGLITGFAAGDTIDLVKTPETTFAYNNGTLDVMNGTKLVAALDFGTGYSQSSFAINSDGHGGSLITHT